MTPKFARNLLVVTSLVSFLVGCATPALHLVGQANTLGERASMSGLGAFFYGVFGLFDRQFAWLANPLGLVALLLLLVGLYNASLIFSLAALLVAQHAWVLVGTLMEGDEGGVKKYLITSLGTGFYLWAFAFLLLAVASLVRERRTAEG